MAGVTRKAKGKTAAEAITNLGLSWEQIKIKGVMKLSCGKKQTEQLFQLKPLKRIFASKLTRDLCGRYLEALLK